MCPLTQSRTREIINDFAREIRKKRLPTAKPSKAVINFRTDLKDGHERDICRVPIELLRYRKDNGRIASDVMDYEKNIGTLDEKDDQAQEQIAKFLLEKDPEKTNILKNSIQHAGQSEPVIITCDGFLINGNRRKLVMGKLHSELPQNDDFAYMKAVILPSPEEPGGEPTLLEIEKLENRYQLQRDGKAEYYGFDRALSIKRKIQMGLSLEDQLSDDPSFAGATQAAIQKAAKDYERDYLDPLKCVDMYLKQFRREGQYRMISTGMGDPDGRWQAFIDYSHTYSRCFNNPKKLVEIGIEEDEIGDIEEAAFDMIRLRAIPDMPKIHMIMRALPKYCATKEGKKEIRKIAEQVDPVLPATECIDEQGKALSPADIDRKWATKNQQAIIYHVIKARQSHEKKAEKETPLGLLEAALRKLNHEDMSIKSVLLDDLHKARGIISDIRSRVDDIEHEIYQSEKEFKKLKDKNQ